MWETSYNEFLQNQPCRPVQVEPLSPQSAPCQAGGTLVFLRTWAALVLPYLSTAHEGGAVEQHSQSTILQQLSW